MSTPIPSGRKMSDNLRERLKRIRGIRPTSNTTTQHEQMCDLEQHNERDKREESPDFDLSDNESDSQKIVDEVETSKLLTDNYSDFQETCLVIKSKGTHKEFINKDRVTPTFNTKPKRHISSEFDNATNICDKKELKKTIPPKVCSPPKLISFNSKVPSRSQALTPQNDICTDKIISSQRTSKRTLQLDKNGENDSDLSCLTKKQKVEIKMVIFERSELEKLSQSELHTMKKDLKRKELEKEEILRKLKMVKVYRSKNNLDELDGLSNKWREVCHSALTELQSLAVENKPTMSQLAKHFNLDVELLQINLEEEENDI